MASKLHVRSNSLPNGSHPCSSRVQEQLNNLRNFEATCTSESVVKGLSLLEDIYFSMSVQPRRPFLIIKVRNASKRSWMCVASQGTLSCRSRRMYNPFIHLLEEERETHALKRA
ncbi:hypothetical protein HN873_022023 [Arachis hypogaea]